MGPLFGGEQVPAGGKPAGGGPSKPLEISPGKCSSCGLYQTAGREHATESDCIKALRGVIKRFADKLPARARACKGCQQAILDIEMKDDKARGGLAWKPYDFTLQSHFTTCPYAAEFYDKRK